MTQSLSACLERSARIAADCVDLLTRIETGITPLLAPARDRPAGENLAQAALGDHAVALQGIDLLSQTLADLASWLDGLAAEAQSTGPLALDVTTALARLRLASMRHRLQGHSLGSDPAQTQPVLF